MIDVKLKFPNMRSHLLGCLDDLKDKETQLKEWVNPAFPYAFWSNVVMCTDPIDYFDAVVNGIEPPNFQEGYILFNSEETNAVMRVVWAFDKVIKDIGIEKPDDFYINSSLWNEVVSSSDAAYDLLVSNNKKYGLNFEDLWAQQSKENEKQQELEKKVFSLGIPLKNPNTRREILKSLERLQLLLDHNKDDLPKYYPYHWNSFDQIRYFFCTSFGLDFCNITKDKKPKNIYKGLYLFDSQEVDALIKVAQSLESVYQEIGDGASDSSYTASSLWHYVVSSSTKAYNLLVNNNKKYGLDFEELMIPLGKID